MTANERQIGGQHYKTKYEHWDMVPKVGLGYFDGTATAYVTRWRKKDGVRDLEKALHFVDKLIEVTHYDERRNLSRNEIAEEIERYVDANKLGDPEHNIILVLCTFKSSMDLKLARDMIACLIEDAVSVPGTPDDGGHHSRQLPD